MRETCLPRVSVCIPTFNSAVYLAQAIESVLVQDFADFEVLIVDDGSSDQTRDIAVDYASRDPRIRWIANDSNLGISGNCNRCLALASGVFIKFLFADDIFLSSRALSCFVEVMETFPQVSLVASGRRILDAQSCVLQDKVSYPDGLLCDGAMVARHCLTSLKNHIGEPTAVMFRNDKGRQGFNPDYCQLLDLEMFLRLLSEGQFYCLAEPLVGFRRHDKQATSENRRNLAYLGDYRLLLQQYVDNSDTGIGSLGRLMIKLKHCEGIWRLHINKGMLDRHAAKSEIKCFMDPSRFFLLRPFYLLIIKKYLQPGYVRCLKPRLKPLLPARLCR